MTVPAITKTWQFAAACQPVGGTGSHATDAADVLFKIKQALISPALSPWTVVSSSNGAGTAGAADNWLTRTNLIWANAGVNHSWIVLKQTGLATNFQICLDLVGTERRAMNAFASNNVGFTGGTATARPTAADEFALCATTRYWLGQNSNANSFTGKLVVLVSTDGQCTRVGAITANVNGNGYTSTPFWFFDRVKNPVSLTGWTYPVISHIANGNTSSTNQQAMTYAEFSNSLDAARPVTRLDSGTLNYFSLSSEVLSLGGQVVKFLGESIMTANDFDGSWPIMSVGITSDTVGVKGRLGELHDLWCTSNVLVSGDTFPDTGTKEFVVIGNLVFPWNGSSPSFT